MKKNKAFTLAEVAIVFVIIGIISVLAISTVKPWDKAAKYAYMRMYNAIGVATYNHTLKESASAAFPENATKLCEALVDFMNVSSNESDNCKGTILDKDPDDATFDPESASYATPMFTTSGGAYVWIGADTANSNKPFVYTKTFSTGDTDTINYYVVFVDLNGSKGPNSSAWDSEDIADVVAYIITDRFIVVPLGYPEIDTRYLVANIVLPSQAELNAGTAEADIGNDDKEIISEGMSFYEAKVKSFGTVSETDQSPLPVYGEVLTYDFSKDFEDTSSFKIDDYFKYFPAPPTKDSRCSVSGYDSSVCSIKIFEYH